MPTLGEDFTDLIAKLQQNRLTPADTSGFAAKLDRVEQTFTPLQKWVSPSGLNVPSITAIDTIFPNFLAGATLRIDADQSLPTDAGYIPVWENVLRDTHGYADLAINTDRLTIPPGMGGIYIGHFSCKVVGHVTAEDTYHRLWHTNSDATNVSVVSGGAYESGTTTAFFKVVPGDYIRAHLSLSTAAGMRMEVTTADGVYPLLGIYRLLAA